ncbi:HlyD family secretion protein [Desulfofundulus thermosubterraneus]|uniref:HlyD family secretion protein n=1 Tax=Desulfofundulus thermosubterraneus DSM 16057 TaxID=1121432 RepID=A0A1M6BZI0_9FIRM|nr:efflux RND transporter periplasmic adaptor subunit [Desulfofundulus thermosubterraneus]SHI54140.1 HlyD family secretion protein [Desulfofundulus thermosubterraneus DSM 16057]
MQSEPNFFLKQLNFLSSGIRRKKIIIGISAIVVLALAGFYVLGGAKKAEGNYITETVKRGTITSTIPASGVVEPVNTVSLSFKNAEVIKKIYVKVGDRVAAGQLLAEQDTANLEAQVIQASANLKEATAKLNLLKEGARPEEIARAEADVKMARASYDLAKSNLERYQQFYQEGYISQADLDKIVNDYVTSEAKLKQAEESLKLLQVGNRAEDIAAAAAQVESRRAQLQMAQKELAEAKLVSPINGIVSAINGSEGQRAAANNNNTSGGGFIVIISEALEVKAQINEADIGRLKVGQKAEFRVNSFPNKTFTGRVSSISPQAYTESNVQLYDAVIQLDKNQEGLMAGMPANVNIIVDRHENTLTIPKGAVTYAVSYLNKMRQSGTLKPESSGGGFGGGRPNSLQAGGSAGSVRGGSGNATGTSGTAKANEQGQQAVVLVLDKSGNPVPRRVVLGLSDLTSYEVLAGLNEGDRVVVGSPGQETASVRSQGSNPPFMPGAGVGMPRAGGGGMR